MPRQMCGISYFTASLGKGKAGLKCRSCPVGCAQDHLRPGEGDGKLPALLRRFCDSGYEGFLSLEPHLADFTGFSALERGKTGEKMKLDGETTWRIALDALKSILWDLNWQC